MRLILALGFTFSAFAQQGTNPSITTEKTEANKPMGSIKMEQPTKLTTESKSWIEAEVKVNPASAAVQKALWLQLANLDKCWVRNFKKDENFTANIAVQVDESGKLFVDSVTPEPAQDCIKASWNNKNLGIQGRPAQASLQIRNSGSEKTGKAGIWLDWLGVPNTKPGN